VAILLEKYEIVCSLFDDFGWVPSFTSSSSEWLAYPDGKGAHPDLGGQQGVAATPCHRAV
jgi:hypothetical protein